MFRKIPLSTRRKVNVKMKQPCHTSRFFSNVIKQHPYDAASKQWIEAAPQHRVKLVQFDLAGTLVDEFCIAPFHAFSELFKKRGFTLSPAQITGPMGLKKIEHIKHLLEEIREEWRSKYGQYPDAKDVDVLNQEFNILLQKSLPLYTKLTPNADIALDFISRHLGAYTLTSGYPRSAADIAMSQLIIKYPPVAITTSDMVPNGTRIAMVEENNRKCNLLPEHMQHVAFFTDAGSDIKSVRSVNNHPWIIGISDTSTHNDIISIEAAKNMSAGMRQEKNSKAAEILYK